MRPTGWDDDSSRGIFCRVDPRTMLFTMLILIHGLHQTVIADPQPAKPAGDRHERRWSTVPPELVADTLEMLAGKTEANYAQIRTWKGKYGVSAREALSAVFAAKLSGESSNPGQLTHESMFTLEFAIDGATDAIFRSTNTSRTIFFKRGTQEVVEFPATAPPDERSIVMKDDYLHCSPETIWPGFEVLRGNPRARNKRTAFREAREKGLTGHYGYLIDPRLFFSFSTVYQSFAGELRYYVAALKGDSGAELKTRINNVLRLMERGSGGDKVYHLSIELAEANAVMYYDTIWAQSAGFNPTRLVMSWDKAGRDLIQTQDRTWQSVDGVFIPKEITEAWYDRGSPQPRFWRELRSLECAVNRPLDPQQFSYTALGLQDGDLILNKVDKAAYALQQGDARKLAAFDEKRATPARRAAFGESYRMWLVAAVGVLVFTLIVSWWRRQPRFPE
jgi:hypothetical protein